MPHPVLPSAEAEHSPLLTEHQDLLREVSAHGRIVDLACGRGRNGLFLAGLGLPVTFADYSQEALEQVAQVLSVQHAEAELWHVDLEAGEGDPFAGRRFSAALVFRYLHRPLFPHLKAAVLAGGLVVYETFTVRNTQYGRPTNPDFLLRPRELAELFADWETLHDFEGHLPQPDREVAQIVARKPRLVPPSVTARPSVPHDTR